MFENDSQEMFIISMLVYRVLPILKFFAGFLMACSVYRHAKSKNINYKGLWTLFVLAFPIIGRLVYCIYHRFIRKTYLFNQPQTKKAKGIVLLALSLILHGIILIVTVVSVSTIGFSVVKSVVDDEPLWEYTCYDVEGNKYREIYEVPLKDREGNVYEYESKWIVMGDYVDQNGKVYLGDYCFLDSDGYFIYLDNEELIPCEECWCRYYYDNDGDKYYQLDGHQIFWDENGDIYEKSGKHHISLFEEEWEY